jgi:hypothetical protein
MKNLGTISDPVLTQAVSHGTYNTTAEKTTVRRPKKRKIISPCCQCIHVNVPFYSATHLVRSKHRGLDMSQTPGQETAKLACKGYVSNRQALDS